MTIDDILAAIDASKRFVGNTAKDIYDDPVQGLGLLGQRIGGRITDAARDQLNAADKAGSVIPSVRDEGIGDIAGGVSNIGGLLTTSNKAAAAQLVKRAKRTVGTTGQYVGAPPGVDSPQAVAGMTRNYLKNVEEGAPGADWYKKSSNVIWDFAGHNQAVADPFVSGLSATSSSTGVPVNFGFAVKGHNQAMAGVPVDTGRFPQSMSPKIEKAYVNPDEYYLGHKQEPFMQQLSQTWAPERVGRGVNDMWEARSMGYPGDAPSATQHSFMDEIRNNAIKIANRDNLAGRSNWNTGSTQAANWVAMKARAEGTPIADAAKDFSDMLPSRTALFSRESVPGVKSGHRPDLLTADDATKASYHDAQNEILQDDLGRDKTLSGLGMLTGKTTNTPGYWQGVSNPSTQAPFLVGLSKGGAGFDEGTQKLTNAAAGWHALMTGQDATAAHFVNPSSMKDATAATMDLGRVLTTPEMRKIGGLLGQDISPVATPSGVNMLAGDTAQNFGPSMKSFAKEVQGITGVKPATNFGTYGSTSAYVAPDWNGRRALTGDHVDPAASHVHAEDRKRDRPAGLP
jgi:hypothetical protein